MKEKTAQNQTDSGPQLVRQDFQGLRELKANLEYTLKTLNDIQTEFHNVAGEFLTMDQLISFVSLSSRTFGAPQPLVIESHIRDLLASKVAISGTGVKLNEDMLRSLIVIPDITKICDLISKLCLAPSINYRDYLHFQCFQVNESGIIEYDEEKVTNEEDRYKFYAITKEEKSNLAFLLPIVKAKNDLFHSRKGINPKTLEDVGFVVFDTELQEFVPSEIFVKHGINQKFKIKSNLLKSEK